MACPSCAALHDWGGDGINWRACRSVTAGSGAKVLFNECRPPPPSPPPRSLPPPPSPPPPPPPPPSPPSPPPLQCFGAVLSASNVASDCLESDCTVSSASWYGTLADAKALCLQRRLRLP